MAAPDRSVAGLCPMGCGPTLILGRPDGAILCDHPGCPRPSAVAELLADGETQHIVRLDADEFTIRHPLRERLDDQLMTCHLHRDLAALAGPPRPVGTYRVRVVGGGLAFHWESVQQ